MPRDFKLFCKYIAPSMTGMLIAGSFSIVDTAFIGQGMGKIGLAAIAVSWPLVMMFGALGEMIGAGAAVAISQSRGSGDSKSEHRAFGNMLTLQIITALVSGILAYTFLTPILEIFGATPELLPAAVEYADVLIWGSFVGMFMWGNIDVIRNDESPYISMWLEVVGLIFNMFLDWLFIIEYRWGASGAAWATVISQFIAAALSVLYFMSPLTKLRFSLRYMRLRFAAVKRIFVTGFPIFGNIFSIIAMLFMHNYQALKYGQVDGLAAYTSVAALESLGSLLMTGLAAGVQPLTAYFYGANEFRRQNKIGNYGYVTAFVLGIIMMLLSFAFRDIIPQWVGLSGDVAELAAHGVLISSTAFILLGVIRVAGFYYQSTGKILDSSLIIYGDAFFALPLCLFTLPIWFGMDGVWLAMPLSRVILFGFLCYLWFKKS